MTAPLAFDRDVKDDEFARQTAYVNTENERKLLEVKAHAVSRVTLLTPQFYSSIAFFRASELPVAPLR